MKELTLDTGLNDNYAERIIHFIDHHNGTILMSNGFRFRKLKSFNGYDYLQPDYQDGFLPTLIIRYKTARLDDDGENGEQYRELTDLDLIFTGRHLAGNLGDPERELTLNFGRAKADEEIVKSLKPYKGKTLKITNAQTLRTPFKFDFKVIRPKTTNTERPLI